ncbi:MAG: sugar transporter ATP-binding protein [Clostridia bacterium]|nr:sugar transporter ATP-binding protein [Clostridia bacterium]
MCNIEGVTKQFPGVKALDNIHFSVYEGEIHAVIGENGAGKSTLMNILSGNYQPDEGKIIFDNQDLKVKCPKEAQQIGIAMIHQELSLAQNMTVAENIFQGRMPKLRSGLIDKKTMNRLAKQYLVELGITSIDPRTLIKDLSVSQMQSVEIAKAISLDAKMLIMDEPTSSLTNAEVKDLLDTMRDLKSKGVSILYISHKLDEIIEIADRVTVLRDGQYIYTMEKDEITIEKMISLMVGRQCVGCEKSDYIRDYENREVVMEVTDLNLGHKVKNVSFKLYKGEVLGLTGLVGAGRSEVLQSIFGVEKSKVKEIIIKGKKCVIRSTGDAIKNKIALVPEGRKTQGLFLNMTVKDNMTITYLKDLCNKLTFINKPKERQLTTEYVEKLRVKTPHQNVKIQNLSGGNQQKAILARWLMNSPDIIFLDEPTHGIDIGSKNEIYEIINELAKQGKSIVLISSEMPEVLSLCDRILVMYEGEISGEILNADASQEKIMEFASGQ